MIYFYLTLLATIFGLLGFLLHAYCFAAPGAPEVRQKIESLRKELEQKQAELREAREEITKTSAVIRSLEQQVGQRNDAMESLQKMATRQDAEIASLQEEAATIRATVAEVKQPAETQTKPVTPGAAVSLEPPPRIPAVFSLESAADSAILPEVLPVLMPEELRIEPQQSLGLTAQQSQGAAPVWRENLNNIIDILDAMEKEVEK